MDFRLSKEQKDIRKAARVFAEGEFDPDLVAGWERECQFPLEVLKKASELGFIGIHIPKKYGGQELGLLPKMRMGRYHISSPPLLLL